MVFDETMGGESENREQGPRTSLGLSNSTGPAEKENPERMTEKEQSLRSKEIQDRALSQAEEGGRGEHLLQ